MKLTDLASRADLNGKFGFATAFVEAKGRYAVQLETRRPQQKGQPASLATTGESILLKPTNLVDMGSRESVQADVKRRQAALDARVNSQTRESVHISEDVRRAQAKHGKPFGGNERPLMAAADALPELRAQLAEAEAIADLLPHVDDGVPMQEMVLVALKRKMIGMSSCDPASTMRIKAFGLLKRSIITLAEALEELNRYAEAQPLYMELVELAQAEYADLFGDPSQVGTAFNNCALCWKRQGLFVDAVETYRKGIALMKKAMKDPTVNLPLCAACLDNLEANLRTARMRLNEPVAPANGAAYAPESVLPPMTTEKGPEAASKLRAEGNDAYRNFRYPEALRWYRAALEADGDAPALERAKILSNISACYLQQGDWVTAASEAERAIDLAPDWPKAHLRLGLARKDRQPKEAITAFERSLELDPANEEELTKLLREAKKTLALFKKNETKEVNSLGSSGVSVMGWAHSPLGKIDNLLMTHGEAVLNGEDGSYLKALCDTLQLWHDGVKASLSYVTIGSMVDKSLRLGEGPNRDVGILHDKTPSIVAMRKLSNAIWNTDQTSVACPTLSMFIDGRTYQHEQIRNATQGLMTVCQQQHGHFHGLPPDTIRELVGAFDLTNVRDRHSVEAHIRCVALTGIARCGSNPALTPMSVANPVFEPSCGQPTSVSSSWTPRASPRKRDWMR